jgi:deoxyribose-phosphate aldolase
MSREGSHIPVDNLSSIAEELTNIIVRALQATPPSACEGHPGGVCADCGRCAALCPDRTRGILSAGAERITATGVRAADVPKDIAKYIDHTLLKPDATPTEIERLCTEAREYGFAAVCVNPPFVKMCAELLRGTCVAVAVVVGFPLGAHTTATKVFEAEQAIVEGATEIDMVINIGALKAKRDDYVREDIRNVVGAAHRLGTIVKVIIEAALLTDEEKVRACRLALEAGADFVKTSTGFGPGGATVHDVELMRRTVGPGMGVKAAGGIRTLAQVEELIAAGATRIGASAGVKIVQEARGQMVKDGATLGSKVNY